MGLFSGLLGSATEVNIEQILKEYNEILSYNERIEKTYQFIRDVFIFTNKRIIMVDKTGITGKKKKYNSIPYKSIIRFSIETANYFDINSELKIWLAGTTMPIKKKFYKNVNINELQSILTLHL